MRLALWIGCLCLPLTSASCGESNAPAAGTTSSEGVAAEAAEVAEAPGAAKARDPEDARIRSKARWEMIAAQDWIQAYDFNSPARKRQENLGMYLAGKDKHEYREPSEPALIGSDGDEAYVELSVIWTPHHEILDGVDNLPEGGLPPTELNVVETWTYLDGEWWWTAIDRQRDFLKAHPKIGR